MNRKSFLKKLGIGVAAVVVTPKVVAESNLNDAPKRSDWNDEVGKFQNYYVGCDVAKERNITVLAQMSPYMHDIQMSWLRMEFALRNSDGLEGCKEKYQP